VVTRGHPRSLPSQHADIGPTLLRARHTLALGRHHWLNIGPMTENELAHGWHADHVPTRFPTLGQCWIIVMHQQFK